MKKSDKSLIVGGILSLLIILGSFAVFMLARLGIQAALENWFGITSEPLQYTVIIIIVLVALFFSGLPFRKAVTKLLKS